MLVTFRFDHEFGMMKAGQDVNGFWHTMEAGTTYVSFPLLQSAFSVVLTLCISFLRFVAYISHVPWVLPILKLIPNEGMQALQAFGNRVASERVRAGSKNKDIFYYLVRCVCKFDPLATLLMQRIDRRRYCD